ncbi:MAG: DUF1292 domain-containing protein, partial [Eubacteriaceae bacterium]|nr:DUF1292 domain-containing protein [Eubacteriaceae bacterium]
MDENKKIVLLNEEGKEEEFIVLDVLEIEEVEYVIANPVADMEYSVVFRIDNENGEEVLTLVDDDEELETVSDAYFE